MITANDCHGLSDNDMIDAAIAYTEPRHPCGSLAVTHVMHNDWSRRGRDIGNVTIRNVMASPAGGQLHIRLLATLGAHVHHVLVDGLTDTSSADFHVGCSILIGEGGDGYGAASEDAIYDVTIRNVVTNAHTGVIICHPVKRLCIENVLNQFAPGQEVRHL